MVRTETFSTKIAVIQMLNLLARGTRHATYSYVNIFDEIDIDQYSVAWEFSWLVVLCEPNDAIKIDNNQRSHDKER